MYIGWYYIKHGQINIDSAVKGELKWREFESLRTKTINLRRLILYKQNLPSPSWL